MDHPRYFDHNATTPLLPEVVDAMLPFLREEFGNPSSAHAWGRRAKAAVEAAREQVAALVGARSQELIFTSGGTEATALALRGTFAAAAAARRHVVTTRVEHPATARVVDALERAGARVTRLGVDADGLLLLPEVEAALSRETVWLSVLHGHNETGVLQPVRELAARAHAVGALLHVDASQAAGKVPLSLADDGFDLLTLAAHKLYGPKGVGALVVREGVKLESQQLGAGHEGGRRAGTENVASIVGFGVACAAAKRDLGELAERVGRLRDELVRGLRAQVPGLLLAGEASPRLPNTAYVLFPGAVGSAVLAGAPELAASTGSACHDGHETAPTVLLEMGFAPEVALGAVRLTLGRATSRADVDDAVRALAESWRRLARA